MRVGFAVRLVLLAAGFGLGTEWLGWWGVVAVGFGAGLLLPRSARPVRLVSLAAGLGWAALLARSAVAPGFGPLLGRMEQLLQVPAPVLLGVTLVFPICAAGAAALVAVGLTARQRLPVKE
jgi:hypothetical protein